MSDFNTDLCVREEKMALFCVFLAEREILAHADSEKPGNRVVGSHRSNLHTLSRDAHDSRTAVPGSVIRRGTVR